MGRYRKSDRTSIATAAGTIDYRDIGSGEPVVFVHGAFLNGALWDDVAFYLPPELRLIRPDLPLGGHRVPARAGADLAAPALARILLDIIEALELHDVTLVGSDGGGVICRLAVCGDDRRARRISGLLFTNCDAFEGCPATMPEAPDFGTLVSALSTPEGRKAFFDPLVWTALSDEEICGLLGSFVENADVRRDAFRALTGMRWPRMDGLETFDGPVKVVWGTDDHDRPLEMGARLAAQFANGELRRVSPARLLVPLDQPECVAEAILDLLEHRFRERA